MKVTDLARAIVEQGYRDFIGEGITVEYNSRPILVAVFADIGAKPRYFQSWDNSQWKKLQIIGKANNGDRLHPIYHPSDIKIEFSGKPGSAARVEALAEYYSEKNGMKLEKNDVTFANELSPFAATTEQIAEQLTSLLTATSKRAGDYVSPCVDILPGKSLLSVSKWHVAGKINQFEE